MHRLIWWKHRIILPYERNAHFRKPGVTTIPVRNLKSYILPFTTIKTKNVLILKESVGRGVIPVFIE